MRVESTPDTSEDQHTSKGDSSPFGVRVPVARVARRPWLAGGILVALCLAVYLPGLFSLPVVDRDEARFAQASRQMFESVALAEDQRDPGLHAGGLAVPMVQDKPRLNKPPLIYWLQAGSAAMFTLGDPMADAVWMYRVPSVVAGIVTVLVTWRLGRSMIGASGGLLAGLLMAAAPVCVWEAHQARADMVLLAVTTFAMWMLWKAWRQSSRPTTTAQRWAIAIGFWCAVGAGIMTKGPITPMIAGLTVVCVSLCTGRWRWIGTLKPIAGLVVVVAMVGPWVVAVANQVGFDEYVAIISDEVLGRSVSAKEGHAGFPGYHLILMPMLFWPGAMLIVLAKSWTVRRVVRTRKRGTRSLTFDAELFLVAWVIPSWLVFEFVSTRLPHYTMPLYPALAILSARATIAAGRHALPGVKHWLTAVGVAGWAAVGVVMSVGAILAVSFLGSLLSMAMTGGPVEQPDWIGTFIAVLLALPGLFFCMRSAVKHVRAGRALEYQLACVGWCSIVLVVLVGVALPARHRLWISDQIGERLALVENSADRPIASVAFHEDSLVYATRGRVQRIKEAGLREWMRVNPDGLIILPTSLYVENAEALRHPDGEHTHISEIWFVRGFNYSKGDAHELVIVEPAVTTTEP